MIIVCAGMFRSGSTWQYQVACELVRRAGYSAKPLGFLNGSELAKFLVNPRDAETYYLYKTHAPDPIHLTLAPTEFGVLYSFRDLRDVAYSMAHKLGIDFWKVVRDHGIIDLCIAADGFWKAMPGVLTQRYESWVSDNFQFVRKIAAHIGTNLSDSDLAAVAEEFDLGRNRTRTDSLAKQLQAEGVDLSLEENATRYDSNSLLHWNHIRTGSVGQWQSVAAPDELEYLSVACSDWLVAQGYEPNRMWYRRSAA